MAAPAWKPYKVGDLLVPSHGGYAVGLVVLGGAYATQSGVIDEVYLKLVIDEIDQEDPKFHFAKLTMPCGREVVWRKQEDIPTGDTPCPCGNQRHWLIRYFNL